MGNSAEWAGAVHSDSLASSFSVQHMGRHAPACGRSGAAVGRTLWPSGNMGVAEKTRRLFSAEGDLGTRVLLPGPVPFDRVGEEKFEKGERRTRLLGGMNQVQDWK